MTGLCGEIKACKISKAKQQQGTIITGHLSTAAIKQKLCGKNDDFHRYTLRCPANDRGRGKEKGEKEGAGQRKKTSHID